MKILIITLAIAVPLLLSAESVDPESYYQKIAAKALGGEIEVTMPDRSRCDIVTEEYAIEVEKADNWKESIGQALNYAFQSNKKAGIVLIVDKPTDSIRLMSLIEHYELPITVWNLGTRNLKIERIKVRE